MKTTYEEYYNNPTIVTKENIIIESLQDGIIININDKIKITPFLVPHRDEYSETVGFNISGPNKSVLFIPDIDKWDLMMLHWKAWELGIKSLYYCRSKSIQRASYAGVEADNTKNWPAKKISEDKTDYEECLSCQ